MIRTFLKSKIHRATCTEACLDYEGSVTIDSLLMDAADLLDHEQVDIYNITTGSRLTTYAILGEPGSGVICINGAAAHLVNPQDLVIIASYAQYNEQELADYAPIVVQVDQRNQIMTPVEKT